MGLLQYFGLALQKLTAAELEFADRIGLNEELMRLLKTETTTSLKPINQNSIEAVASSTKPETAYTIVKNCKKRFDTHGMRLFAFSEQEGETNVVSFKSDIESSIIRFAGTKGKTNVNNTDMLCELIDKWSTQFEFVIHGAGSDWLQLEFTTLPDDKDAFAEEVFEVCPDIKTEFSYNEKLIDSIRNSKILGLWWD